MHKSLYFNSADHDTILTNNTIVKKPPSQKRRHDVSTEVVPLLFKYCYTFFGSVNHAAFDNKAVRIGCRAVNGGKGCVVIRVEEVFIAE